MQIQLNGKPETLPGDMAPLSAIMDILGIDPAQTGIAIAINDALVPRSQWPTHMVEDKDTIEIISAHQGG